MTAEQEYEVDVTRLESLTLAARASLGNGPRRLASQFVRSWLLLLAVVFILPALADGHLPVQGDFAGRRALFRLLISVIGALCFGAYLHYAIGRRISADAPTRAARALADWRRFTGPRWWSAALRMGAMLTLGVGVPVGLLAAFLAPTNVLPQGGRLVVLPMFVGMTALWAVPMGFVIRWMTVRSLRGVMRPVA
ncbi:MAG: hypothetical protein ACHQQR_09235 [Gemmatimonadales bacterium]